MGLQEDLDRIRELRGLKPTPPGNIITDDPLVGRAEYPADEYDDPPDSEARLPDSPLIPKRGTSKQAIDAGNMLPVPEEWKQTTPENLPDFRPPDLTVLGNDATAYIAAYQGRQVELTSIESAAIRKVVLQAIARVIRAQLDDVAAMLPKRRRKRAGASRQAVGQHGEGQPGSPGGFVAPDGAEPPAPRRRGRPRKVRP